MGGSASEEFLAPAGGRRGHLRGLPACDYAANTEAVTFAAAARSAADGVTGPSRSSTPRTPRPSRPSPPTSASPAAATLKNLLVKVDGEIVAVGVPGDREVDMGKLEAHLAPAVVELVTEADFAGRPDLVRGYVGPQGVGEKVRYLADPRVAPGTAWITGANEAGTHARNVVAGRDFEVGRYVDVVVVAGGRPLPELRHRPQAGPRHRDRPHLPARPQVRRRASSSTSSARTASPSASPWAPTASACPARSPRSPSRPPTTRACAGPREVAPADVHVVAAGKALQTELALDVAEKLAAAGLRVLVDDRPVSPRA